MIKKTHPLYVFLIVFFVLFPGAKYAFSKDTAIIIKSQNLSAYNNVVAGFKRECLNNNITIRSIYNLNGKMKVGRKMVRKIKKEKPDIILTIGVLATTIAKEEIEDIPILFCMVINHERYQLVKQNVTGISNEVPIENQVMGYQTIVETLRNIGVIYDPSNTGNIIEDAGLQMERIGIHLVKYEIKSSDMIDKALDDISGKIDALWILPDRTVVTKDSFNLIKTRTLENNIPLLCTNDVFVKAGALMAVFSDYVEIGMQAAQIANKILRIPSTNSLGIIYPDTFKLVVNSLTAKKLGLNLDTIRGIPHVIVYP
ncbi:MAG: ABC transporter substrate-binding protein [Candidatus Scalindua sp.]|nr:ABC transporter substrate-binding protein [Candidatus Scalindua sp.]